MTQHAVVFAGGGSGGHIYPSIAIAEHVLAKAPDTEFVFLCSDRAIDTTLLMSEHIASRPPEFHALSAKPFSPRPLKLLRFMRNWKPSVRTTRGVIKALKLIGRDVTVIGTGGFVAAPAIQAAKAEKVKRALVSLDATPGKATRWAASRAQIVFTAKGDAPKAWKRIRPLVRSAAIGPDTKTCRQALGLDPDRPVVFISGGSQGAKSINTLMQAMLDAHAAKFVGAGWQVIHQAGPDSTTQIHDAYRAVGVDAIVRPIFGEVGLCWGAANFAIGRAGAGTIGEAWANQTPTLLFPYPYHRDRHQTKNAQPLTAPGLALILEDKVDPKSNMKAHEKTLLEWLEPKGPWSEKSAAFDVLGRADGAETVALFVIHG